MNKIIAISIGIMNLKLYCTCVPPPYLESFRGSDSYAEELRQFRLGWPPLPKEGPLVMRSQRFGVIF